MDKFQSPNFFFLSLALDEGIQRELDGAVHDVKV